MKKSLEQEVAMLRRQMKEISEQFAAVAGQSVEEAEDAVGDYAAELTDTARSKWQAARGVGRRGRDYVEEHPWQAIGTGLALGFLAGFLSRRSGRD